MPENWKAIRDYMDTNKHIIDGINDRKYRLPNAHLISSLLCGHFSKWMNSL